MLIVDTLSASQTTGEVMIEVTDELPSQGRVQKLAYVLIPSKLDVSNTVTSTPRKISDSQPITMSAEPSLGRGRRAKRPRVLFDASRIGAADDSSSEYEEGGRSTSVHSDNGPPRRRNMSQIELRRLPHASCHCCHKAYVLEDAHQCAQCAIFYCIFCLDRR